MFESELRQLTPGLWQQTLEWLRDKPDLSEEAPMFDQMLRRIHLGSASHHMGDISEYLEPPNSRPPVTECSFSLHTTEGSYSLDTQQQQNSG